MPGAVTSYAETDLWHCDESSKLKFHPLSVHLQVIRYFLENACCLVMLFTVTFSELYVHAEDKNVLANWVNNQRHGCATIY